MVFGQKVRINRRIIWWRWRWWWRIGL